jgi:hypothetical protein
MAGDSAFFVQFPHPGGEHNPKADVMPWNTGGHRRKFMIAPGRYKTGDGSIAESELVFWGEWEAPSSVVRRWPVRDANLCCFADETYDWQLSDHRPVIVRFESLTRVRPLLSPLTSPFEIACE